MTKTTTLSTHSPQSPANPSPPPSPEAQTLISRWYPGVKLLRCTPLRLAGMLPVLLVLCITFLAYLTAVPATLFPLRPHYPLLVYPLLLLFHFLYLNVLANYLLLILSDPRSPPDTWAAPPPPRPVPHIPSSALAEARHLAEEERLRPTPAQHEDHDPSEHESLLTQRPTAPAPLLPSPPKPQFRFAHLMHERAYDGSLRYCRICKMYKPDRTHHCSVCRRCVLRMDHHCVFVNNCVSFYNHKFFISFVSYAFLGCVFVVIVSFPTFMAIIANQSGPGSVSEAGGDWARIRVQVLRTGFTAIERLSPLMRTLAMVGYISSAAFAFALAIFVGLHFYLVSKGRTTIEMYELTDTARAARVAEYDLGASKNCRNVFGTNPLCWFFPTRAYIDGDGIEWERRISNERNAFNV